MTMDMEEMEIVLEKIWELHDKLSDAILSISRSHFLNSIKKPPLSDNNNPMMLAGAGFVYVKGVDGDLAAVQEAKSLNAIRSALENLEEQLQFFHTVQNQQRSEKDAALARLEQSRIILAMRLAEHQGRKYKVIEEARTFVGDIHDNLYGPASCYPGENSDTKEIKRSNFLVRFFLSSLNFFKKSLRLDHVGGILGNAALIAFSMLVVTHIHQAGYKDKYVLDLPMRPDLYCTNITRVSRPEGSASGGGSEHLDVLLARG